MWRARFALVGHAADVIPRALRRHREARNRKRRRVPWLGGRSVRDHRWRASRQPSSHLWRPPRGRGRAGRAGHRRGGGSPLGLHPLEDHDRHGRRDVVLPAGGGIRARRRRRARPRQPPGPRRAHRGTSAQVDRRPAHESERADHRGHGSTQGSEPGRRRHGDRGRRARRRCDPAVDRLTTSRSRLVHTRRQPHPHDTRLLPPAGHPRARGRRRVGRDRCRVRAHAFVARLEGHSHRQPTTGVADEGP